MFAEKSDRLEHSLYLETKPQKSRGVFVTGHAWYTFQQYSFILIGYSKLFSTKRRSNILAHD